MKWKLSNPEIQYELDSTLLFSLLGGPLTNNKHYQISDLRGLFSRLFKS